MNIQKTKFSEECIPLSIGNRTYGYIALSGDLSLPAIGGCRILEQQISADMGRSLSMDLARTMQKKSQAAHLELSGGKTVLFIPRPEERSTLLMHYAEILNQLGGRYITAIDIGSTQSDMDFISTITPYVTCHTKVGGDPSKYTAKTVLQGAMIGYSILHSTPPQHIVIQGLGKVGLQLLELLSLDYPHIRVSAADTYLPAANKARQMYPQYTIVEPAHLYHLPCDIFIPAGASYVIDEQVARTLPCKMLAIAANNAFTQEALCENILKERGVTVLPDYLINSGGVMCCAQQIGFISNLAPYLEANRAAVALYVKQTALVAML